MSTPSNAHSQVDQKGQTSSEQRKDSVESYGSVKPKDHWRIFVLCWVLAPQSSLCPYLVTCEYDLAWRPSPKRHRSEWWVLIHYDWYHPKGKHRHKGRWWPWDAGMEAGIWHHKAEGCQSYWPSQWVKRKLRKRPPLEPLGQETLISDSIPLVLEDNAFNFKYFMPHSLWYLNSGPKGLRFLPILFPPRGRRVSV